MNFFVITPRKPDSYFEEKKKIVNHVATQLQMNAHYGPEPPYSPSSREKTFRLYADIDFFIVDLSYERPSCYFEAGFVQAMNKPTNLIAVKNTVIHQVLDREKLRFYKDIHEYEALITSILSFRKSTL